MRDKCLVTYHFCSFFQDQGWPDGELQGLYALLRGKVPQLHRQMHACVSFLWCLPHGSAMTQKVTLATWIQLSSLTSCSPPNVPREQSDSAVANQGRYLRLQESSSQCHDHLPNVYHGDRRLSNGVCEVAARFVLYDPAHALTALTRSF